jgi:hypothetical protein
MKPFITTIILTIIGAVSGPFLALAGASLAGLPESSWSLEPLVYLAFGFLIGGPGFLLLLAILTVASQKPFANRALAAVLGVLLLSFLSGLLGVPFNKYQQEEARKERKVQEVESGKRYRKYYSLLRFDPQIALREEWYHAPDEKRIVYSASLRNLDVDYGPSLLSRLYEDSRPYSDNGDAAYYLKHPSFDPDQLAKEFQRSMDEVRSGESCYRLIPILRSPNAKEEWFAEVAASPCGASLVKLIEEQRQIRRNISGSDGLRR